MLNSLKFFAVTLVFAFSLVSCIKDDSPEPNVDVKAMEVTATPTASSITLSWKPVSGVSWYRILAGKKGEALQELTTMQDLTSNPIKYELKGLAANTAYDVKIEGKDYLSGGSVLSKYTGTVSTLEK